MKFDQDLEGLVWSGQDIAKPKPMRREYEYPEEIRLQTQWMEHYRNKAVDGIIGKYKLASAPEIYTEFRRIFNGVMPKHFLYKSIREAMEKCLLTGTMINADRGLLWIEPDYMYDADDHTAPDDKYYFNLSHTQNAIGVPIERIYRQNSSREFIQRLFGTNDEPEYIIGSVIATIAGVAKDAVQIRYNNKDNDFPAPVSLILTKTIGSQTPILVIGANHSATIGMAIGVEI